VLRLQQQDRETRIIAPAADQFAGVFAAFFHAIGDPRSRPAHHDALVRQAELMAQIRSHALAVT
jgi:NDP-hexose-3-ketoreductase